MMCFLKEKMSFLQSAMSLEENICLLSYEISLGRKTFLLWYDMFLRNVFVASSFPKEIGFSLQCNMS